MTKCFQMHQCADLLGAGHCIDIDDTRMIVCRKTLWMIAVLVLLASISTSLKPRSRRTRKVLHQQRSRAKSATIKVINRNREDVFAHSVPLYHNHRRMWNPSLNLYRTRRNYDDYIARRNTSDYYAERRAVMERYYARQREINARYANRTGSILGSKRNDVASQRRPVTRNATLFSLGREYPNKDISRDSTFRYPYIRVEPIYNESWNDGISIEPGNRRDMAPGTNFGFKYDTDLSQKRNSSNIERNTLDYYVTPTPCTNVSLSGTFAPKERTKHVKNCTLETEQTSNRANNNNSTGSDYQNWGTCEGKIVYQHNLLLGLKGPSNLDTLFEVIIQGPICITCVEVLRYNETRAMVTLDSGGRGHEYVKIRLKGYENEGFSYIIKVWGVKKIDQNCDNFS
ncbi:uncharacterized protein [Anoplolepis gracilipes]|uniref:uncharacterized protein n=1 Tax=Anoplolepis gracilipes TaxID=354296 RepID=UPI003B9F03C2